MMIDRSRQHPEAGSPRLEAEPAETQISLLSHALASLRDAVVITDRNHRIIYANPAIEDIHGYKPGEVIGKNAAELFENIPGNPPDLAGLIEKEAKDGFWIGEILNRRRDGSYFPVRLIENAIFGEDGRLLGYIGISQDISERQKTEELIRESELRYRSVLESLRDPLHVIDRDFKVVLTNQSLREWNAGLGLTTEMIGWNIFKVYPFLPSRVRKEYRQVFREGRILTTEEVNPLNNREIITEIRKIPVLEGGRVVRVITVVRDVTEARQSEVRLREASRLEAAGSLALGIAHEFNNLLMGISGYSELARADLSNGKMVEKAFDVILRQADRGKKLIQHLNSLARRSKPRRAPVDLIKVLDEVITLQERSLLLTGIKVKKDYRRPASILGDYSQIEQAFFNLVSNAGQAITRKKTGVITLTVRNRGRKVEVRVTDNGVGIPRKVLPLIFTPFFSTKKSRPGQPALNMGLGLWVCRQIVEENGGTLSVKSRRGEGATFTVTFPRGSSSRSPLPSEDSEHPRAGGSLRGRRGLIVEDEKEIAAIWATYLRGQGAVIRVARNGAAALRLCQRESFDFICLDYIMPGLAGKQLLTRIRKAAPESRIVVVSGKLFSPLEKNDLSPYLDIFLSKPLCLEELKRALTRTIYRN